MTQQVIQVGAQPNDGEGTPLRNSFTITNENFTELYARAQTTPPTTLVGETGDVAGWYAYDSTYFYYCFADYDGSSTIWAQISQIGNVTVTTIQNGTSNVKVTNINGNVTTGVNGFGNVVTVASTGQYVTGVVSALGNVTGSYILGNGSQLTGLNPLYNNSNVTTLLGTFGANNISTTGNITSGNVIGDAVYSTGNISATGNITTAGFFVGTFIGNIVATLTNIPGPGGAVVFNDGTGNAAATAGLVFDNTGPNTLTVLGSYSATANVISGNVLTGGLINATANITGGNILTGGIVSSTGNTTAGNLLTGGSASITGNVTGGNITIGGIVTATGNVSSAGNVTGGNLRAVLNIDAGGNVSAVVHTGTTVSVVGNVISGNISTTGIVTANNITTGNNITIGAGVLSIGMYTGGTYPDGIVLDYDSSTSNARISAGAADGIQFYNEGLGNVWLGGFHPDGDFVATGNIYGQDSLNVGNLIITANTITSSTNVITIGGAGNVGNIIIAGNLQVQGNTTSVNSNNVTTNDLVIFTANNAINSAAADGGGLGVGPLGVFGTWTYNNSSNVWATGLGISATGNITGGNIITPGNAIVSTSISVNVNNGATAIVNGGANGVGNIGSASTYFNTVFAKATSAQYADLAENYTADADYTAGTVVIFGGDNEITISTNVADERVAGAISTNPAHLMNAAMPGLPVALRGRVPVNVVGAVVKGDSLVTSSTAGHAQSVGRSRLYGQAVFAKALETNLEDGKKVIIAVII